MPGHQDRAPHGHPHRRRVFRGRCRCAPCAPGRRSGVHRRAAAEGILSGGGQDHRCGAGYRRPGHSSRLRFPFRERGIRRGLREERHRLHRPAGERDPRHGLQVGSQEADGEGRRAADAGLSRRQSGSGFPQAAGRRHRLSGADQGGGRRRRQGHARGGQERGLPRRAGLLQARGGVVLRRPACADRKVPAAPAPHRVPGLRRQPRQLRVSVRARLFGAAPPPEGAGGSAGAGHDGRAPRRHGQGRGRRRQGGRLTSAPARSSSSSIRTAASTSWR